MINSSFYTPGRLIQFSASTEPLFVVGGADSLPAQQVIAGAVSRGARTVVMQWNAAGVIQVVSCNTLIEGVLYFFVRSVPESLSRWAAAPIDK